MKNKTHYHFKNYSEYGYYLLATYLLSIFESPSIVHPVIIKNMQNRCKRNSEENSEDTTKCRSNESHNEDIE